MGGGTRASRFFPCLPCPLPSWLSFLILAVLPTAVGAHGTHPGCHLLSVHRFACDGPSTCREAAGATGHGARKLRRRLSPRPPWLSLLRTSLSSEPGLHCVFSWRDYGRQLPPLSPAGSPEGRGEVSELSLMQFVSFVVFLGTGACADVHMMEPGN